MTLDAGEVCAPTFTFTPRNQISPRSCPNGTAGVSGIYITDRQPGGSFNPEMDLVANEDYYGDWAAGTLKAILATLTGNDAGKEGNDVAISIPKAQYSGITPVSGGRTGFAANDINFLATEDTSAGDDEFSITFS